MTTTAKRRNLGRRIISDPGPPTPVPPDPSPDPQPPIPPLPVPDPEPEPDRAAELLRLAELPHAVVEDTLTGVGSASIIGGFVRMSRPRAVSRRHSTRRLANAPQG
jgi:hypothetical protein